MGFWRSIKHFWELWVAAPMALKVLYFVLACGLAAGLAAGIADLGLIQVTVMVGAPVLVLGLIVYLANLAKGSKPEH